MEYYILYRRQIDREPGEHNGWTPGTAGEIVRAVNTRFAGDVFAVLSESSSDERSAFESSPGVAPDHALRHAVESFVDRLLPTNAACFPSYADLFGRDY